MKITHVAILEFPVREFLVKVFDTTKPYVKVEFWSSNELVSTKFFAKSEYLEAKVIFEVEMLCLKARVRGA